MERHRKRLGEGAVLERDPVRQALALARRDGDIFGIAAADQHHLGAAGRIAAPAGLAMAAAAHRHHRHAVADGEVGDGGAARHHFAGEFMAEHEAGRDAEGRGILGDVQVAAADAAGGDPQHHLIRLRCRFGHGADAERAADGVEDGDSHGGPLQRFGSTRKRRKGNHGASKRRERRPQMPVRA